MTEIPRTFYVYHRNEKAELMSKEIADRSSIEYINDPMLELCADFKENDISITGSYGNMVAIDSFCIGNTNAVSFELDIDGEIEKGWIQKHFTIRNLDEVIFTRSFVLKLSGIEPLYLGHLFFGMKTSLPRFAVEPNTSIELRSESSRSFGGQAFGMRRKTLKFFSANFPWLNLEDKKIIDDYIEDVLNVEPHIIDPYPEAHEDFPPIYATLGISEASFPKLNRDGFYYNSSLSWQEAR